MMNTSTMEHRVSSRTKPIGSIEEYVALRPKQYSYITENGKKAMTLKGLSKNATARYMTHQKYVDQVLGDEKVVSCKIVNIQSKNFNMYTQYNIKRTLVNYENKRYWLDSIYSLPYGHPMDCQDRSRNDENRRRC